MAKVQNFNVNKALHTYKKNVNLIHPHGIFRLFVSISYIFFTVGLKGKYLVCKNKFSIVAEMFIKLLYVEAKIIDMSKANRTFLSFHPNFKLICDLN